MTQPADSSLSLHGFDAVRFRSEYWQRQPVLLRAALPDLHNPIEPDELAGLALEADAESRLVIYDRQRDDYQLEHGPFDADRFSHLPERDWSLLVQAVDQWSPEVAALIEPFRALVPDWRIDDVMVSYATAGGGVGPHYDHYDVFLVQGLGRRRWRIGPRTDRHTALRPDSPLRLMEDFPVSAEYLLEPGDILYVPPGWGHWGEAEGDDCMTYSVGLRAPDQSELIAHWADHVLEQCSPFDRYTDPPAADEDAADSGWLTPAAVERARQLMLERVNDKQAFADWLGTWLSEPKYPDQLLVPVEPISEPDLAEVLADIPYLIRNPGSRLLLQRRGSGADLCVDGQRYALDAGTLPLARRLCALPRHGILTLTAAPDAATLALLTGLYNQGCLWLEADEEESLP